MHSKEFTSRQGDFSGRSEKKAIKMINLEKSITDIARLYDDRDILLMALNAPKIGWISIHTPEELIHAAGCIPFRLIPEMSKEPQQAAAYMHRNICSYVLKCFEEGLLNSYEYMDGIIIVNACDARRRLYDVWTHYIDTKFIFLLDLPKAVNYHTKQYFTEQLNRLVKALGKHFGIEITRENLVEAVALCNETRDLIRKLYAIRKNTSVPINGSQILSIIKASMSGAKREFNEKLEDFLEKIETCSKNTCKSQKRVLLCGSYFDHAAILDLIEETGASIVCEDISNGLNYFKGRVEINGDDIISDLADYYLERATCARMIDTQKRFEHISNLIMQYDANRVIYFTLKFCDNNYFDFPYIRKKLADRGVPVLFIEGECVSSDIGQLKTRIQTFLG